MELWSWQGVLPSRSTAPSPHSHRSGAVASRFRPFGALLKWALPVPLPQHPLWGLWPLELPSVCQQSVGRTVSPVVPTGKCFLGIYESPSGAVVMIPLLHHKNWGCKHPLSQERNPLSSWGPSVQGLATSPQLPRDLCHSFGCSCEMGGSGAECWEPQEHPLQGHQAGRRAAVKPVFCWGEIQHAQPGSSSLSAGHAVSVCLLWGCTGTALKTSGWRPLLWLVLCKHVEPTNIIPSPSHTPSSTVYALAVKHGATGRSKHLEEGREADS